MRILAVDDTPSVLTIIERMLSTYDVTCVGSGAAAIEMVKRYEFDLVLMDVVMEGMTGPEAAQEIRLIRPELPIVFMTGFPDQLDTLAARSEAIVEKPFTVEKLNRMVAKVLTRRASG